METAPVYCVTEKYSPFRLVFPSFSLSLSLSLSLRFSLVLMEQEEFQEWHLELRLPSGLPHSSQDDRLVPQNNPLARFCRRGGIDEEQFFMQLVVSLRAARSLVELIHEELGKLPRLDVEGRDEPLSLAESQQVVERILIDVFQQLVAKKEEADRRTVRVPGYVNIGGVALYALVLLYSGKRWPSEDDYVSEILGLLEETTPVATATEQPDLTRFRFLPMKSLTVFSSLWRSEDQSAAGAKHARWLEIVDELRDNRGDEHYTPGRLIVPDSVNAPNMHLYLRGAPTDSYQRKTDRTAERFSKTLSALRASECESREALSESRMADENDRVKRAALFRVGQTKANVATVEEWDQFPDAEEPDTTPEDRRRNFIARFTDTYADASGRVRPVAVSSHQFPPFSHEVAGVQHFLARSRLCVTRLIRVGCFLLSYLLSIPSQEPGDAQRWREAADKWLQDNVIDVDDVPLTQNTPPLLPFLCQHWLIANPPPRAERYSPLGDVELNALFSAFDADMIDVSAFFQWTRRLKAPVSFDFFPVNGWRGWKNISDEIRQSIVYSPASLGQPDDDDDEVLHAKLPGLLENIPLFLVPFNARRRSTAAGRVDNDDDDDESPLTLEDPWSLFLRESRAARAYAPERHRPTKVMEEIQNISMTGWDIQGVTEETTEFPWGTLQGRHALAQVFYWVASEVYDTTGVYSINKRAEDALKKWYVDHQWILTVLWAHSTPRSATVAVAPLEDRNLIAMRSRRILHKFVRVYDAQALRRRFSRENKLPEETGIYYIPKLGENAVADSTRVHLQLQQMTEGTEELLREAMPEFRLPDTPFRVYPVFRLYLGTVGLDSSEDKEPRAESLIFEKRFARTDDVDRGDPETTGTTQPLGLEIPSSAYPNMFSLSERSAQKLDDLMGVSFEVVERPQGLSPMQCFDEAHVLVHAMRLRAQLLFEIWMYGRTPYLVAGSEKWMELRFLDWYDIKHHALYHHRRPHLSRGD